MPYRDTNAPLCDAKSKVNLNFTYRNSNLAWSISMLKRYEKKKNDVFQWSDCLLYHICIN